MTRPVAIETLEGGGYVLPIYVVALGGRYRMRGCWLPISWRPAALFVAHSWWRNASSIAHDEAAARNGSPKAGSNYCSPA